MQKWRLHGSVVDLDSLNPDRIRIGIRTQFRIQGFDDQKLRKKYTAEKNYFFSKIVMYLSLGLLNGHPSYRRSLQPSKENIQHFKIWNLFTFFLFLWVIFSLLDPDPDCESGSWSWDPIESGYGSTTLLHGIQIWQDTKLIFASKTWKYVVLWKFCS